MECLLPYLCMVTVPHIMVGLEKMLDYRGVGLGRFHCIVVGIEKISAWNCAIQWTLIYPTPFAPSHECWIKQVLDKERVVLGLCNHRLRRMTDWNYTIQGLRNHRLRRMIA